jgi:thymidylate synthase (FAD)
VSEVKLIWITPNAEQIIIDCARVSNPANQGKPGEKLINYLIEHKHWSPFEMACACVEIVTYRGIVPQILRHRSFHFQEFSQRYAKVSEFLPVRPRRQDTHNRQNSYDDLSEADRIGFQELQRYVEFAARNAYTQALEMGIAKESARFLLPTSARSVLYMQGTIRDWIHYLSVRTQPDVQLEHREIALAIDSILQRELPTIYDSLLGYRPVL